MASPSAQRSGLIAGSSVYLASNLVHAAVPFLLLPVLTRALGPAQYGQVAVFQALVGALTVFTVLSVPGAANRKYFDGVESGEFARFIGSCLLVLAAAGALTLLVLLPLLGPLSAWTGLRPDWIVWAVVVAAAGGLVNLCLGQWQVRGQATRYGALQVTMGLGLALLAPALVLGADLGAEGRILAQLVVMLAAAAFGYAVLRRGGMAALAWNPAHWREVLTFGVPLLPHVAGVFLLGAADRMIVQDALGLEAAGIYMVAVQLALALALASDAFNKAYVPWLYERLQRDVAEDKARIVRGTYGYFAFALAVAALVAAVAPWLVPWLAGDGYDEAARLLGWLALGQAFQGMYLMVTNYIFFSRRTAALSLVTVGSGLAYVALALVLARVAGLQGVAIAFAVTMGLRFLLTWAVAQRVHPMPWFAPRAVASP